MNSDAAPPSLVNDHAPFSDARQRFQLLDVIRGIAIVLVLLFHAGLLNVGWLGVPLFFTLSGFLITLGLLRDRNVSASVFFSRFYLRRVLRIMPLYFACLLVLAVISRFVVLKGIEREDWLLATTFTYNFYALYTARIAEGVLVHFWSLAVEEQFYLIWPWFVWFCPHRWFSIALSLIVLSTPILRALSETLVPQSFDQTTRSLVVYCSTLSHLDTLCLGALLAVAYHSGTLSHYRPHLSIYACAMLCAHLLVVTTQFGVPIADTLNLEIPELITHNGFHIFFLSFSAAVCGLAIQGAVLSDPQLSFRPLNVLAHLGRISYGLYIIHIPVGRLIRHYIPNNNDIWGRLEFFALYFPISYCLAVISSHWFESRFLAMGRKTVHGR